jgi:hypothetical protein
MCTYQKLKVTNANHHFLGLRRSAYSVTCNPKPFQAHTIYGHSPQKELSFEPQVSSAPNQPIAQPYPSGVSDGKNYQKVE